MKHFINISLFGLLLMLSGCVGKQHQYFTHSSIPLMTEIGSGSYKIGEGGKWAWANGPRPIRKITIQYDYFISREPITNKQWAECVKANRCEPLEGQSRGHNSALVSWDDTQDYIAWLNETTGKSFRLPTESEWEYAIKGKEPLPESWFTGNSKQGMQMTETWFLNDFGLYPRLGRHGEWVQDCWNISYNDLPLDGSPRTDGDCQKRTFRNRTTKDDFIYMINGRHSFYKDIRGSNIVFRIVHQKC